MEAKTALIIPDCHIPYEDKRAYELMLRVGIDLIPDEIVILGDYADFYGVNSHGKSPGIVETLKDEVQAVIDRLTELNKLFPTAKKIFIEGNHEYRLARYISNSAPELFGMIGVKELLKLDDLGFKFIPYGPNQKYRILGSSLFARHEPLGGGTHVAHGTVNKAMASVIFGHTHRIQESQAVAMNGQNFRGISSGWLGNCKHPIFSYVKNHHQWALGFSVLHVVGDIWFNQLVHIIDYKCISGDTFYAA